MIILKRFKKFTLNQCIHSLAILHVITIVNLENKLFLYRTRKGSKLTITGKGNTFKCHKRLIFKPTTKHSIIYCLLS